MHIGDRNEMHLRIYIMMFWILMMLWMII